MLHLTKLDSGKSSTIEPPRLRRVQAGYFSKLSCPVRRQLRIFFESPWKQYKPMRDRAESNQGAIVFHQKALFCLAVLQELHSSLPLRMLEMISAIRHPNVADIQEAYYHKDKFYVISEYLDLSLLDLYSTQYPFEEWEIATLISQILEGFRFLCSAVSSHEQISIDSIRLTLYGDVKLVLDMGYHASSRGDPKEYNIAFVSEIINDIMSWNEMPWDEGASENFWSDEAYDFLSQPLSEHLESSVQHTFLNKAVSPKKLVPRIQYTLRLKHFL